MLGDSDPPSQPVFQVYESRRNTAMNTQDMGAPLFCMQVPKGGGTPMQVGVNYQIMRTNPIQGGWAPGMQDIWNMMVSMQQNVTQMTEKFMEQQKEMYAQMWEIDTLKEANAQLTKKLQEQQGQIDELTKRTKT